MERFSLPDETSRINQTRDPRDSKGRDKPWAKDEYPENGTHVSVSEIRRGRKKGGIGAEDWYRENEGHKGTADPEMIHLVGEYEEALEEPSDDFDTETLDFSKTGGNVYDQAFELTRVWNDRDAGVAYKFGKDQSDDVLV